MTDNLLITQDDIKMYAPLAEIPNKRIDAYIFEAMELDLKPVLNDSLYYDFVSKFNDPDATGYADYVKLLHGTDYTYQNATINFPGVKPMLSYYALARFVRDNPVNITSFGVVTKTNPTSEPVSSAVLFGYINEKKSNAVNYQNQVIKYLENNPTLYSLYNTGGASTAANSKVSFKIFKL